jgi:hypothetical protein
MEDPIDHGASLWRQVGIASFRVSVYDRDIFKSILSHASFNIWLSTHDALFSRP